ncbi:MAG: ABC-three component system middle component 2, partial [Nocardioides sp.]
MTPLNGPLEVAVRVLMVLVEAFPEHLDLNRLVLLDHGLLHSADLGGPESLHPPVPIRAGEL